jgi:hypothetical protein
LRATIEGVVDINNIAFGHYRSECCGINFLQTNFVTINGCRRAI